MHAITIKTDQATPIAEHDFCRPAYDNSVFYRGDLEMIYVIISTPRCGSTWLCSEIYNQTGLVIHEYLQPHQYIPYLASRFQNLNPSLFVGNGSSKINLVSYFQCLAGWRAKWGILGINAHISHIPLLIPLIDIYKKIYPQGKIRIDYLYRNNKYLQAASHAIALQRRCWSKAATDSSLPDTTVTIGLLRRLGLCLKAAKLYQNIIRSEELLREASREINFQSTYCYEDLHQGAAYITASQIASQLGIRKPGNNWGRKSILTSQSSSLNKEIADAIKRWMPLLLMASNSRDILQAPISFIKRYLRRNSSRLITIEYP